MFRVAAASLFLCLSASPAFAWGDTAHTAICEIAWQELKPAARKEVARLIAIDLQFQTFNRSCIWPDHPRIRSKEHYVNVERDELSLAGVPCPTASKCVVSAIASDLKVLRGSADDGAKLAALKSLGHWVGDVHQPLHVSFSDDRGGNSVGQSGPCRYSLHSVWDTCIIETSMGRDGSQIGRKLRDGISDDDRAAWIGSAPTIWADESLAISRQPDVGYCVLNGDRCDYARDNPTFEKGETERRVNVDRPYLDRHALTVTMRIRQAGVRLGNLLNGAFGEQ